MFWVEGRERILFHIVAPTCAQYYFRLLLENFLRIQSWFQRSSMRFEATAEETVKIIDVSGMDCAAIKEPPQSTRA